MYRMKLSVVVLAAALTGTPALASSWTYQNLYVFTGGTDGSGPSRVIADSLGNLFGTTLGGGASGGGVVFELSPAGQETVLGSFPLTSSAIASPLVLDVRGNLDGVAGFAPEGQDQKLYQITAAGKPRVVYSYTSIHDGGFGLTSDAKGNLYGASIISGMYGGGAVYKITPSGVLTTLHSFGAPGDGLYPNSPLLLDGRGNIYGVTSEVMPTSSGKGTLFKLAPDGTETILHVFAGGAKDGSSPSGNLVMDASGNLFGTTLYGGSQKYYGTVFEVTPAGQERLVHSFPYTGSPQGLTIDPQGNLYGVVGAVQGCSFPGSIYQITNAGLYQDIYDPPSGSQSLIANELAWSNGALYGTASGCAPSGAGFGMVYKLSP
jgi:uncharacterized repeat protein (TIGR03803 family)